MYQKYHINNFTNILLIVFTIILSTIFLGQAIIFGQGQEEANEQEPQPIPLLTDPQAFNVLSKSNTTTDLGTESRDRNNCITANQNKSGTINSNQSIVGRDHPEHEGFYQCYYGCLGSGRPPPYCESLCLPILKKSFILIPKEDVLQFGNFSGTIEVICPSGADDPCYMCDDKICRPLL